MLGSRETGTAGGGVEAAGSQGPPGREHPVEEETPPGRAGCRLTGLVNWRQRPWRTSALFAAANTLFWFVTFSSLRTLSLTAILLSLLVLAVTAKDFIRTRSTGAHLWRSMTTSWEIIDSGQDSRSGSGPQLSDSLRLFLQETSAFKQQNPGKFCLLVCSLCTFFAVLGRYIPGIVISYILVLGVFLWPLISSHEVGLWLEPVLQKLDFGIGEFLQKVKENHERRILQAQTDREGIESDLSSMFPKLDSTVCKEMSVSDTEVSDVTWTDNGTFNLSEGHTPQTENSEDLDREEAFTGGLQEFPSLDNGATTNGDDDDDLSLGLPSHPQPQEPIKSAHTPRPHKDQPTLELVNQMAGDVIAAAVTAAIQERIEAAVSFTALSVSDQSGLPESTRLLELAEESDSEVEDFELLDQSELEQLEGELGLGEEKTRVKEEAQDKSDKPASSGFFSKLLRRH
ncbi:LOW QUALITY PROTEIN: reticulophagy regulator 1-like [Xyrichtys novacula]|uniref:LOW QUALITY PROTEIN: reticulophagy regulator 1-like n=1 Tax=Xyrichtys novacula TaxID=13765 RepID=A0AAV1GJV0_XYRNO|nr:LOW QUALITY PROTEIN: reticulophagy regulator 1-like [Xyrichtys novacula]